MSKFFEKIFSLLKSVFKWIFSNIKNLLIVVLVIFLLVVSCDTYITKKELAKTKIELVEANDSTFIYKNKVGELYTARETYIADINQLKQTNEDLYEKYKNLKDHPIVIEKIKTIVKIDSIQVKDSLIADPVQNTYTANFKYNDKWCNISGSTLFNFPLNTANTSIYNILFPATFTTNVIEKDKKLYFLTNCDNPHVQINNIEGAIVSPQQSKVLKNYFNRPWGIMAGIGVSTLVIDNTIKIYPALQITVGYKFISF